MPAGGAEPDQGVTVDPAAPAGPLVTNAAPGVVPPEPATPAGPGMAVRSGGRAVGAGPVDALRIPGVELPGERIGRLLPVTVLTSTATTLVMAFLMFGKRRRDEEPPAPEAELARGAARPYAFAPASALALPQAVPAAAPAQRPVFDPGTGGTDVDLPRWRRPSLLAARKSDPLRDGTVAANLTFGTRSASGGARERRQVRYRIVRLLDRPDEMLGVELGTLDQGDEVEIVEQRGTYRRVLIPDGREGWLHKMTLGDLVTDDGAATASEPEVDADVLLAYLAARARG